MVDNNNAKTFPLVTVTESCSAVGILKKFLTRAGFIITFCFPPIHTLNYAQKCTGFISMVLSHFRVGISCGFRRSLPVTAELRDINQGGRKLWLAVGFPVKEGVRLPRSEVCQVLVSLVTWTTVFPQSARTPWPEVLKLSLWKAEGKQNRSESRFNFRDCSLTGIVLWFSAFKKILVPICFIDISYCKSDSFSAY